MGRFAQFSETLITQHVTKQWIICTVFHFSDKKLAKFPTRALLLEASRKLSLLQKKLVITKTVQGKSFILRTKWKLFARDVSNFDSQREKFMQTNGKWLENSRSNEFHEKRIICFDKILFFASISKFNFRVAVFSVNLSPSQCLVENAASINICECSILFAKWWLLRTIGSIKFWEKFRQLWRKYYRVRVPSKASASSLQDNQVFVISLIDVLRFRLS